MECLLNPECYNYRYNCTFYDPDSIPRDSRRNTVPGIVLLVCYVLFEILYLPCIAVFLRKENIKESCYKLMLFLGLISMVNIHSSCLLIGTYAVRGDVFCDRPLFNYIIGMFVFAFYTCECIISVILALNRCIEMWDHRRAVQLFDGFKVYIWMAGAVVYGLWMGFAFIPPVPNGMMVGYFWQVHIGYMNDTQRWYEHVLFPYHNLSIAFAIPLIYGIFYVMIRKKMGIMVDVAVEKCQPQQQNQKPRTSSNSIFVQVLLIGLLTMVFSFLYVYMQYFPVPPWFMILGHYSWASTHGMFAIIMIVLNKHIRRSIKAVFIEPTLKRWSNTRISSIT